MTEYLLVYRELGKDRRSHAFETIEKAKDWAKEYHAHAPPADPEFPGETDRQWRLFEYTHFYALGKDPWAGETQRIFKLVEVFTTRKYSIVTILDKPDESV